MTLFGGRTILKIMKRVFIRDVSLSDFGKLKTSLIGIIQETFEKLNMDSDDVDGVFIGLMNPEGFTGVGNIASYITDKLGIYGKPAVRIET
ncbi:MAG TPA: thiolase, partial [Flexistipes sinusarabici]|nr:thiolase [Flexistipes sinusarabici]